MKKIHQDHYYKPLNFLACCFVLSPVVTLAFYAAINSDSATAATFQIFRDFLTSSATAIVIRSYFTGAHFARSRNAIIFDFIQWAIDVKG
jgi:hypothetical protein